MALGTTVINPVDANSKPSSMGGFFKTCYVATANAYLPQGYQIFKWVCAGTNGGDIVVEGVDGQVIYLPAVPSGALRPVIGRRILSTGTTPDGTSVTTTASPVIVYGGE